ncbi:MAG: TonB-dependent receptor [Candidatus Omnitrophota bacterium]
MLKYYKRSLLFGLAFFLSLLNPLFCEEDYFFDLEPIIVTKEAVHLLEPYYLEYASSNDYAINSPVEALGLSPVDLQSRALKAGIQTDYSLRGSTFQGVLVLIDGSRINDPQTAHHNSDIPLTSEDIERIEVIPGVSSSVFGPDAIGGAINFILKKPGEKKRVLQGSFGEHQAKSGLFSISDKLDNLGVRFSLENKESDGFYEDTDFENFIASFVSSLDIPGGEFNVNLGYQEKEFGAYDFYTPASGFLSKEWTKTFLLNTGFNLDKDGFIIKPNFLWRRHFDKFALDKTTVRSRYLNHHRTDVYTPSLYFQDQIGQLGRVGLGIEYGEERINSTNLGKHNRNHKSIFLDESKELSNDLDLGLSFRLDDFDDFNNVYTGSGTLRYSLTKNSKVHLGISKSTRIPSFTELYYNDPTTLGNAGLSAEKSLSYEMGHSYKKDKLTLKTTGFFRYEEDLIDWIKRSATQAQWQVENITEAVVSGVEEAIKLQIHKNIGLDANYTYIDKRTYDQGYLYKYGPNYIRHLLNAGFNFNLPFGNQSVGFSYKKKPRRDGWFLLHAHFSYNLNKYAQVFLRADNLLNVEYQEIEGIPQPGRWVEAGLRLEW